MGLQTCLSDLQFTHLKIKTETFTFLFIVRKEVLKGCIFNGGGSNSCGKNGNDSESRPGVSKSIRDCQINIAVLSVCLLGLYRPYSSDNKERINVGSLLKKNVI